MTTITDIMQTSAVIPVLVIEDAAIARPLAEALVRGGLRVLEVTLRTGAALEAIAEMKKVEGAIVAIYETLAEIDGRPVSRLDDKAIWQMALEGTDSLALAALDRFCLALGATAGDRAICQGAKAVVIAGGLGLRIKDHIVRSGFAERFAAKGRFRAMMQALPVKLITHPQPGLFGAAAAFAQEHHQ